MVWFKTHVLLQLPLSGSGLLAKPYLGWISLQLVLVLFSIVSYKKKYLYLSFVENIDDVVREATVLVGLKGILV